MEVVCCFSSSEGERQIESTQGDNGAEKSNLEGEAELMERLA